MNIRNSAAKLAALAILPLATAAVANAQSTNYTDFSHLSYSRGTNHETWHSVLLISGILLFAGLVDDNSGLIILGGAGVLVALSETNGNAYRSSVGHGTDLLQMGNVSLGVNPFAYANPNQRLEMPKPAFVIQAKFKF